VISPVVTPVDFSDQKYGAFSSDAPVGIVIWYSSAKAVLIPKIDIENKNNVKREIFISKLKIRFYFNTCLIDKTYKNQIPVCLMCRRSLFLSQVV
jgi:hypothetical protein